MTEPKIYTKNVLNSGNDYSFSSGDDLGSRLYDGDKNSKWQSDGENDDANPISIYSSLTVNGYDLEQDIDTLILLNHNLKDVLLTYWNGSTYATADSESAIADDISVFDFSEVTTQQLILAATETQTVDAEKFIGELIICHSLLSFSQDMVGYDPLFVPRKANELLLADGGLHRSLVPHSLTRSSKYEAKARFDFLTLAEIEILQALKDTGDSFLWQPESTQRPDEIYHVNWVGNFNAKYVSAYKGAGYRLDMELKEI